MVSHRNRIPFDYFTLPFCAPTEERRRKLKTSRDPGVLGIGQILQGERSRLVPYDVRLLEEVSCAQACTAEFSLPEVNLLVSRIAKKYRVRLTLDELPVVVRNEKTYTLGYPLGDIAQNGDVHVINHLSFTIMYHIPDEYESLATAAYKGKNKVYRIVGFEVSPSSVANSQCPSDKNTEPFVIPANKEQRTSTRIPFTYSVRFVESRVRWATRFDTLLKVSSERQKMQVFAISNSIMMALALTASLAVVLFRTLRRDCARFGLTASDLIDDFNDDFDNDVGWRMLRGDVFRSPVAAGMLSVLCGSGAQLFVVTFITLLFALLGVVSPHRRGDLITGLLVFWVVSSGFGGYVAARLHKAMGGMRWKTVTFGVALVLPGIVFSTFFIVNLFLWMMGSSGAAPFFTIFVLLFLWLGVSVPLAFAGTYAGYQRKVYDFPVRTNQIPRPIPVQPSYLKAPYVHLLSGILPFGVVCIELRVILNSVYLDEFYHFFGFLIAVFTLLAITCAEVSVVVVFVKLSNSDYGWWWNSWFASSTSGAYVFLYSMYYLLTSPGADPKNIVSNFLFIAYSIITSLCFSLLTGTIGFMSSLAFVRRIYSDSIDD
ncbi:Endomembrane protein [Gracilaria domingensis]|nr:Endomembrane protein [Gracilaria domingensis]